MALQPRFGLPSASLTTWGRLPSRVQPLCENSDLWRVATNGNGACGMHAVWGTPREDELFCDRVRHRLPDSLPGSWPELVSIHGGVLEKLLASWMDQARKDAVDLSLVEETETEQFLDELPEPVKNDVECTRE